MIKLLNIRSGIYEPLEPAPKISHPGITLISLVVIAWVAVLGAGYAIIRAVEALVS